MKGMIKATDGMGRTVLAMAAMSGKDSTFDTVLLAIKDELDLIEVSHPLFISVSTTGTSRFS